MKPRNALLLTFQLLLQFGVFGIKSPSDPPPVIIRLDDITAGWCEEQSVATIKAVLELKTPINAGLIGIGLDESVLLSGFLASVAKNPLVEIVSHSFYHRSFAGKSVEYQEDDLIKSNEMSNKLTNNLPMTFIPPRNEFDDHTVMALRNNSDFHILSGQCNWYPGTTRFEFCKSTSLMNLNVVAPDIKVNGLYVLPAGAVLGDRAYWNNYLLPASVENATAWLDSQIANQGFGVLMLHPVEFALDESCASINQAKIKVLTDLIKSNTATIPRGKWKFMLYHEAVEYLTGDVLVQSVRAYVPLSARESKFSWPFIIGVLGVLVFMLGSCAFSYFSPEITKAQRKLFCYSPV